MYTHYRTLEIPVDGVVEVVVVVGTELAASDMVVVCIDAVGVGVGAGRFVVDVATVDEAFSGVLVVVSVVVDVVGTDEILVEYTVEIIIPAVVSVVADVAAVGEILVEWIVEVMELDGDGLDVTSDGVEL